MERTPLLLCRYPRLIKMRANCTYARIYLGSYNLIFTSPFVRFNEPTLIVTENSAVQPTAVIAGGDLIRGFLCCGYSGDNNLWPWRIIYHVGRWFGEINKSRQFHSERKPKC